MAQTDIVFNISADTLSMIKNVTSAKASLEDLAKATEALEADMKRSEKANDNFGFSAARMAQQMDRLRMSYDPVYAASKRYEVAVEKVERAHDKGAISAAQYQDMLEGLASKYLRVDAAAEQVGTGARGMGGSLQQVGFQIQDFAVQVGAGTSATQAFAQQFPQLAGAFGPVGVAVGTLAAVGLPLLVAAFGSAKEEATATKDAIEALTSSTQNAADELTMLKFGIGSQEQLDAIREISRLTVEQAALAARAAEEQGAAALYYQDQANALQLQINAAREKLAADKAIRAELEAAREAEKARVAMQETMNDLSQKFQSIMNGLSNSDISGPWERVLGSIQAAINKAGEYARAAGFGMSTGSSDWAKNGLGFTKPGEELLPGQPASSGGGGGGGGGGSGMNPIETQLEALRTQLMTEEQLEMESYLKRQEMLQQALDQRLITQQEYASLMEQAQAQHADKMTEIDAYAHGSALDKAGQFFGDMASAMQGGNEKMLRIAKAFGAAQALISAWQGAAEALKLPFPQNISAFAKVLATGLSAVNAIKGAKPGGTTSGGRGAAGATSAATAAPASPLDVRLTGISPGDMFSGAQLSNLLDQLSAEAGDRGYRLMVAQ